MPATATAWQFRPAGRPLFILSGVLSDPPCSWHGGNFKCRSTITGNGVPIHWHFKPAARASDGTLYQLRLKFSSLANPSSIDDMDATRIPAGTPEHGQPAHEPTVTHGRLRLASPGPGRLRLFNASSLRGGCIRLQLSTKASAPVLSHGGLPNSNNLEVETGERGDWASY